MLCVYSIETTRKHTANALFFFHWRNLAASSSSHFPVKSDGVFALSTLDGVATVAALT